MKARFLEPQPPVKTINSDGKTYVYICLNEQYGEEVYEDPEGTGQPLAYYEYDYNEFSDLTEKLDLEDINAHPENYLNYDYSPQKEDPGVKALAKAQELEAAIERGLIL